MALVTGQDFILMALRKLGHIRPGYTPSPELLAEVLDDWALFFDELSAEKNMEFSNPDYIYPVTGPGSQNDGNGYTIGPSGADWIGPRPTSIIRANLVQQNTSGGSPVYITLSPVSGEEWHEMALRSIPAINVTSIFWYDPQFPNGVFNVFPPLNGNSIELYQWGVLIPPATLGTAYNAPPAYKDMVVWGLAARNYYSMAKELNIRTIPYGVVCARYNHLKDKIRRLNRTQPRLRTDFPSQRPSAGFYDSFVTYTGEPY